MAVDVLLGLQWGDEGKGKIVDYLAKRYQVVARFQGGPNAGHTLEFDGIKHVLHQIPSGIFHPHVVNIIGNGVVLDPVVFMDEAAKLEHYQIDLRKNLFISKKAQIILPTHRFLDAAYEQSKGDAKIGSTLKGIGPTYQDKIGRTGLRVGDIVSPDFEQRYKTLRQRHIEVLNFYNFDFNQADEKWNLDVAEAKFLDAIEKLRGFQLTNTEYLINQHIAEGKQILAEGAQGSLLDIDYGTYPFVTSSNTTVAGACTGMGVAPKHITKVIGIFKAYCTRVGGGPFPTELTDEVGEEIRQIGREFGSTTGRPRRCGWLDIPALKYAIMLSGVNELYMMKTDVLNTFESIRICTHYALKDGSKVSEFPFDLTEIEQPIYNDLAGWNTDIRQYSKYEELPVNLTKYVTFIEKQLDVPVKIISTGPDRTQTIYR